MIEVPEFVPTSTTLELSEHRRRQCLLWVKTGSPAWASECPLLGVEQTSISGGWMSACSQEETVRPEGAEHQWRKDPPRELSVDLVADGRGGRVTGRFEVP